jgi:hypothetical protein
MRTVFEKKKSDEREMMKEKIARCRYKVGKVGKLNG